MNAADDVDRLLAESAEALFARHSPPDLARTLEPGGWAEELWAVAERAELPLLGVGEDAGGAGGTLAQWGLVVGLAARHAAPIPLAETGVAAWLLAAAGVEVPAGPLTVGTLEGDVAPCVPYARHAGAVALLNRDGDEARVALVPRAKLELELGRNLAGEPRDAVRPREDALRDASTIDPATAKAVLERLALARAIAMAGALEAVLATTVAHVRDRVQFGVPLARLPLVRDRVSLLAEEAAAARAACEAGLEAYAGGAGWIAAAAAKIRAGEAAGTGARLAHQLHGAIGMTHEHALHIWTRRLWAWRDEAGPERWWAERLGRHVCAAGPDSLWPALAAAGEAARVTA